ncbi:hypothetical protein TNCV_3964351 [Trichonephila clavipes]|nr:hypothetical protein TNCV_3964351 [Trichonephila clavipes]
MKGCTHTYHPSLVQIDESQTTCVQITNNIVLIEKLHEQSLILLYQNYPEALSQYLMYPARTRRFYHTAINLPPKVCVEAIIFHIHPKIAH